MSATILTGRYGEVFYDSLSTSPHPGTQLGALNAFKLSMSKDYEEVTCFQDTNKVYVPGLIDISGSVAGFLDATVKTIFDAAKAATPGWIRLMPNTLSAPNFVYEGPAYIDASLDCSLKVPKISGNFKAAGSWFTP